MGASEEFMDQYRSAFRCADVRALVDCFNLPLQVVSVTDGQASLSVVADGEELSGVLERLVSTYQRLGVREPVPRTLEVLEPMDGVSVVLVQWALRREDGGSVYDFTAVYTLARVGGRLGIVSIEHDELARMRAAIGALTSRSDPCADNGVRTESVCRERKGSTTSLRPPPSA